MGLLRWMRGGDDDASTAAMSAGLSVIDGLFRPSRVAQTEHVEQSKRLVHDTHSGAGIDLDNGVARVVVPEP